MTRTIHLVLFIFLCGCGPFTATPGGPDTRPPDAEVRATAPALWSALANAVERGSIPTCQRLAQYVVVLARDGELSSEDVAAFDAAFAGAATSDRPLNADDAKRLRNIGNSQ